MKDNIESPQTEIELENWMKKNCYNFNSYSIGGNAIYEGFGIEISTESCILYYLERGQKNRVKSFLTEKALIQYTFNQIKLDKWANSHCIGFTENKSKSTKLAQKLTQMGIKYLENEIPYSRNGRLIYRTFVFGCDVLQTNELKATYFEKI